jgi:two-component system, response regulator PdtaR
MIPLRVMVVEDEALMGALFGEVLEGMGYTVCAIETTEDDAVAAATRCKPDLLLVDVQLAVGSGLTTVAKILSTGFIPHVFYSGDISGVQAARPGAIAIQKPFRVPELARAIALALGGTDQDCKLVTP